MDEILEILENEIKRTLHPDAEKIKVKKHDREMKKINFSYRIGRKRDTRIFEYNIYQ